MRNSDRHSDLTLPWSAFDKDDLTGADADSASPESSAPVTESALKLKALASTETAAEGAGTNAKPEGLADGFLRQELRRDGLPRRPMNAFLIFSRWRRGQIRKHSDGVRAAEISAKLGLEWRKLPAVRFHSFQSARYGSEAEVAALFECETNVERARMVETTGWRGPRGVP